MLLFHATWYLVVAVQPCMEWIPVKKTKSFRQLKLKGLGYITNWKTTKLICFKFINAQFSKREKLLLEYNLLNNILCTKLPILTSIFVLMVWTLLHQKADRCVVFENKDINLILISMWEFMTFPQIVPNNGFHTIKY